MYSEILHGSCNSVVLHAADKSFLSFISKYWLRGNDFLTHILKLCQQKTSFQGHHLLCVLNFRSFLLATSSRTSSFPSKYRKREDTQLSNRYLVDFHLQWLAITDWERVLLYFPCCLPLSQFFVYFEGAGTGKSDHALTCYVMVQLRLYCNYRTYLGLTNCIKPSELSLFCSHFQGILAGSFTPPEISLRNSCCRLKGKTH